MRRAPLARVAAAVIAVMGARAGASAQAMLVDGLGGPAGYGVEVLATGDDSISAEVDLTGTFPSGVDLFGATYLRAWVNTNGNVSFDSALATYTPTAFPGAPQPIIAPWWADVDTRGMVDADPPGQNRVYWALTPSALVATWYRVGYFSSHVDLRGSFQLILRRIAGAPETVVEIELRYALCEWTTGDASGGSGGFGGTPAQAGFEVGATFRSLPGSRTADVIARVCGGTNVGEPGVWRFRSDEFTAACGNGFRETGEECDDGNADDGDGCDSMCRVVAAVDAGVRDAGRDAGRDGGRDGGRDAGAVDASVRRPPPLEVYGGCCRAGGARQSPGAWALALAIAIAARARSRCFTPGRA